MTSRSFTVKYHLAHILELQEKFSAAKDEYELLLNITGLPNNLRADILRQLGEPLRNTFCAI